MTDSPTNNITPTKITMERNITHSHNENNEIANEIWSLKQCLATLKAIVKNTQKNPSVVSYLLAQLVNKYLPLEEAIKQQEKKDYSTTKKLIAQMHSFQRGYAFFPSGWCQKTTKSANPVYAAWSLNTQKPITLNLSKHATITCKVSSNHSIELYIHGFKPDQNPNNELIADFAHAIYACACAYSSAIVTIHSENVQDYEALIDYLYAYQKIQTTLTPKQSQSEPQVPNFQIKLEDATYDTLNEGKIDNAVEDILKAKELNNLYRKAQLLTPPNRIMDLR